MLFVFEATLVIDLAGVFATHIYHAERGSLLKEWSRVRCGALALPRGC
jgi:hypothetical protein